LVAPFVNTGKPVKVTDILEKIKVEKTNCSPYFRVYTTLKKAEQEGVVKFLGKGTFQKVGSKKAPVIAPVPKTKKTVEKKKKSAPAPVSPAPEKSAGESAASL
jgi:hypothetical protein